MSKKPGAIQVADNIETLANQAPNRITADPSTTKPETPQMW